MLKAIVQPVTPFEQNASILYCSEQKKCAIVDPGGGYWDTSKDC